MAVGHTHTHTHTRTDTHTMVESSTPYVLCLASVSFSVTMSAVSRGSFADA